MIPGAVTREVFEEEVLPTLKEEKATSPLIVPYCTVGYRSGLYCKELVDDHGLPSVRNGEGVILWTFDGDGLVRPVPGPKVARAPTLQQPKAVKEEDKAKQQQPVYGRRVADEVAPCIEAVRV